MSIENRIQLLWNLANSLQPDNHVKRLLKSFYLGTCRKIAKKNLQLPNNFSAGNMCQRCSSVFCDGQFSLKLHPQRIRNAKAKKLVAIEDSENRKTLTKKQRKRAKWLKKKAASRVEITCNICQTKTMQPLIKPKQSGSEIQDISKVESNLVASEQNSKNRKRKKKKKSNKDKNAGLKIPQSILSKKQETTPLAVENRVEASVPKENSQKKMSSLQQTKNLRSLKTAKVKKPSSLQINQSKTQQKNSALKLASLFKSQTNASTCQENLLQKFLK